MTNITLSRPDEEVAEYRGLRNALLRKTPEEIEQWVDENVNNMAEAKDAIANIAVAVSILAKRATR